MAHRDFRVKVPDAAEDQGEVAAAGGVVAAGARRVREPVRYSVFGRDVTQTKGEREMARRKSRISGELLDELL